MSASESCPECKGKCCIDQDYRCRVLHMAAEIYEHVCDYCWDGTKYVPPRTYEEGIAEGERRATAAVVAYLRERANAPHPVERGVPSLSPAGRGLLLLHADSIERGDHRREEKP